MAKPYYSDDKVDDIHWEIQQELEKKKKSPVSKMPSSAMIFFILAVMGAIFIALTKNIDTTKLIIVVVVFIIVAIFLSSQNKKMDLLSEQDCKNELYWKLRYKQQNPLGSYKELPEGEIKIDIKGRLRWFEGAPWKRYTGFSIITPEGLAENYYAAQDPYTGDLIETNYCPEGFNPANIKDIVMIASPELMEQRRWGEYGGWKGGAGGR